MSNNNSITMPSFREATGKIPFTFLNDYMFKVVLQKDENILKAIISACLGVEQSSITYVRCLNSIEPGKSLTDKTYILDIKVIFNNATIINFEMQVADLNDWTERSLAYLSRCYSNIERGDDYVNVKPTYQIGFLNYTLFKDNPKFFAKYQMRDVDNHYLYSSKFNLFVIDLNRIDLATDADMDSGLAYWAKLFKATTWEELRMVAEKSKRIEIEKAARILYEYNQNLDVIEECIRRDEFIARQNYLNKKLEEQEKALEEQEKALEEQEKALAEKDNLLSEQAILISKLQAELSAKTI